MSNTTKDSEAKLQSLPPSAVAFLRSGRQPWMDKASCAGMDPEIFQRPDEVEDASVWPAAAKQHCAGCCVREHCLEYAMKHRCRGSRKFPRVDHRNSPVDPEAVRAG